MSDADRTGALKRKVKDTVEGDEHFHEEFAEYWELFEAATEDMEIRSFYMRTEVRALFNNSPLVNNNALVACDIAAICDGLLIDLEVNKPDYSAAEGDLTILPLSAIGSVNFHPGSVQDLRDTQNALLTVTIDDDQRYWFAKTEDEWGYLVDFAQDLIREIAAR